MSDMDKQFACFNRKSLEKILPHRGAALRKIDGVFISSENPGTMFGFKEVHADDPDLDGHFPGAPTYPGYAQDEFASLTAAALILSLNAGLKTNPYVVQKIARYRRKVVPGDRLTAEVKYLARRGRFVVFSAVIRNKKDEVVAEYEKIVGAL
jgi:3-hydroxyacyl-[acyl-carrier-protein] dehydratase